MDASVVHALTASLMSTLSSTGGGDSTAAAPPFFFPPFSSTESGTGTCSGMRATLHQDRSGGDEGENKWYVPGTVCTYVCRYV